MPVILCAVISKEKKVIVLTNDEEIGRFSRDNLEKDFQLCQLLDLETYTRFQNEGIE